MNLAKRALPFLGLLFFAACGDDGLCDNNSCQDFSATQDMTVTADLAGRKITDLAGADFAGVNCGAQTCGAGSVCCIVPDFDTKMATEMCMAGTTCGAGGIPAACDGPEECSGGTPNCCINLALSGGAANPDAGMSIMGGASCVAACPGEAKQQDGGSIKTKLCHNAADCAGYSGTAPIVGNSPFDHCCGYGGLPFKFCAPGLVAVAINGVTCD